MKKAISLLLSVLFITFICSNLFAEDKLNCEESMEKGAEVAEVEHRPGLWFGIGFGAGFDGAFIGTIIVTAIASSIDPQPTYIPNKEIIDEECYTLGYSKAARKTNINNAIGGSVLGTAVLALAIVIVIASMDSGGY